MERWLSVAGFEGLYEVSNRGRVRSLAKGILSHNRTLGGYHLVHLYCHGKRYVRLVSRLVLTTFRGNAPSGKHQAAHKDGDRDNNALTNLRWATPKSNNADKLRHGTHLQRVGEALGRGVLNHVSVERIRDLRRTGCTYKEIAEWIRTTTSNVSSVLNRQTWSHV